MNDGQYSVLKGQIEVLRHRIDLLEANSPQGESGAVACSPAGEQVSLPRSPDRQLFTKFKSLADNVIAMANVMPGIDPEYESEAC